MKNDFRQLLHIEPEKGWLNDPNGLCFFNGEYHVYFQYSPDSPYGSGGKCWGHRAGSFVRMRSDGAVLRPDTPYDKDGVYSGCGFVKDDTLYLFYTGNVKEEGDHDYIRSGRGANVILVTTKDGHSMSEKKVLLRNSDYPDYCSCHVRDPKVWEENGRYKMVLGARTLDDKGCVLFYDSDDLYDWKFEKADSIEDFGYMWECPDVFDIGGHRFLSVSPQGLPHEEYRFQNVYSSGHFLYDSSPENYEEWDYGFDFYAPQTFEAPDGRRILIGWMGIGDIPYTNPTAELGWQHCLTIPCEVSERNGKLIRRPAREFNALKKHPEKIVNIAAGETLKTELPFYFASFAPKEKFALTFEDILEMSYENGVFALWFISNKAGGGRDVRKVRLGSFEAVEIIADRSSLEIFINGGEKVMSTRFYPDDTMISIHSEEIEGTFYPLDGIEVISDAE